LEGCSEKIGSHNKTAEIDESKFSRRKFHRGHPVRGQWVFGGTERESGRTFLVPTGTIRHAHITLPYPSPPTGLHKSCSAITVYLYQWSRDMMCRHIWWPHASAVHPK
jgi:hypothetical protein